ncbi:MAG: 3'-5' exonuclease [Bacteroidetes bacterium]|nr:3'-5' exonuclease [Bacteroidota bacterium]
MKLNLTKPLVFMDIEATGLTIGLDRIVEIALIKVLPDNSTEEKSWRVNPEIPIPEKVSKLHGIYDKDVANEPIFKKIATEVAKFIGNADLAGYNSNKFDVPLLVEEFLRVEVEFDLEGRKLIDVQNIFHLMEPRNLVAAYKFYCEKPLVNAHSAMADTLATFEVFKAQLQKYESTRIEDEKGNIVIPVKNDMEVLSNLTTKTKNVDLAGRIVYNDDGVTVFNFGKHKDKPVADVLKKEPGYYSWMMNGDFPLYTKRILTKIRLSLKN